MSSASASAPTTPARRAASTSASASSWICSSISAASRNPASRSFLLEHARWGRFSPLMRKAPDRGRVAVQPRHQRLEHVGPALAANIIHGARDGVPAGDRVVAIDHFAGDAERLAAVDDVYLAVLAAGRRGDALAIVRDDHQHRQFVARPGAPDHAGGEIALGGARIAAGDDGDGSRRRGVSASGPSRGPSRTALR